MSAVLHHFNVALTDEQAAEFSAAWRDYSENKSVCFGFQPVGCSLPWDKRKPSLEFAVLDAELSREIFEVIQRHKEKRP